MDTSEHHGASNDNWAIKCLATNPSLSPTRGYIYILDLLLPRYHININSFITFYGKTPNI